MSRWAKSEEELKWRVVICMCCHKMARLRPFPLNADASGRAHRLNWWCTTSWMRGTKARVDSWSRSSSLPETVDSSTENSSVVSREPAVITKFRWTWNKFIFSLCRGHRRTSDDWLKTCSCTESWLKHMRRWLWIWEACSLNLLIIFILLLLTGSWDVAPAIQVLWTEAWIHRL